MDKLFRRQRRHGSQDKAILFSALMSVICAMSAGNACHAGENGKIIPPTQWWGQPSWSPDGKYIFVLSPPPERIAQTASDGKVHYSYPVRPGAVNTKGLILSAKNFSQSAALNLDLESTSVMVPALFPKWSSDSKFLSLSHMMSLQSIISIYNPATGKELKHFTPALWPMNSWAPVGAFFTCDDHGQRLIYDAVKQCEVKLKADGKDDSAHWSSWSPDGKMLANSNHNQGGVTIWNTQTGAPISSAAAGKYISWLAWSAEGKDLVYGEMSHGLEGPGQIVWYVPKEKKVDHTIKTDGLASFEFSPDHKLFAYANRDKLHILDAATLQAKSTIQGPRSGAMDTSWSPDSRYILVSKRPDGIVTICEAATGKMIGYRIWDDLDKAYWTPDSKTLVITMRNRPPLLFPFTSPAPGQKTLPFPGAILGTPGWEKHAAPKNPEECFVSFDAELSKAGRERFMNTPAEDLGCFGGGSFITDSLMSDVYSKWDRTDLVQYFAKLGIDDPRDVTGIIIDSYWRKLHGQPLHIEEQARSHAAWWNTSKNFLNIDRPASAKLLNFQATDQRTGPFSVGAIKTKVKLVGIAEEGYAPSFITELQKVRKEFSPSELAVILFVIPHEWPENRVGPFGMKMGENQEAKAAKEFRANPTKDIFTMRVTTEQCKDMLSEEDKNSNMLFSPCRAYIISENRLKCIFNQTEPDIADSVRALMDENR